VSRVAEGLLVPRALFVTAPCYDGALSSDATPDSTCQVRPDHPAFLAGLKAVELAFGQDLRVGSGMPLQV
jgi:acetyl-CoA carboxylase carboxyltransferase component